MNKKPDKGETGPKESRSVYHDDDNLQDEQEQFDRDNACAKINEAIIERLAQLGTQKEGDPDTGEVEAKSFSLTIGFGYPDHKKLTGARKAWMQDFVGITVKTKTAEDYLELVEAEADCLIRLGKIDLHLETTKTDAPKKLKELEQEAEESMRVLQAMIQKHQAQPPTRPSN